MYFAFLLIIFFVLFIVLIKSYFELPELSRIPESSELSGSSDSKISVILFYANWCSHCPLVKDWYVRLVNNSPFDNIIFTMVEESEIQELKMSNNIINLIKGYPTIMIMDNNDVQIYLGERTEKDLLQYLQTNLKNI